jgi:ABC-2 type transport system ATP-binding protein
MYQGKLIAIGTPSQLKKEKMKGELLEVVTPDYAQALEVLSVIPRYQQANLFGSTIHVKVDSAQGSSLEIKALLETHSLSVQSLNPIPFTLDDVFISLCEESETPPASLNVGKGA